MAQSMSTQTQGLEETKNLSTWTPSYLRSLQGKTSSLQGKIYYNGSYSHPS